MGVKARGFKEFGKKLKQLEQSVQEIQGTNTVSFSELFPDTFMQRFSDFQSIQEMFDQSPFTIKNNGDLDSIPSDEWDKYVSGKTRFNSWTLMQERALSEWTARKLGL
ncbi:hypothetical protein F9802_15175 [Bacillus aerolatus]|uniref:Uncharacterized protein n=1 Tax=Bacillus aerolatus TaxID=2653354 RepID=A0A6I1FH63_9BACI|nr:hypothetical protein [Bacillus aerolatus]KAB7704905.1 hypothetical protein F9802_15175 [Bacillus aerolatus]